MASTDLHFWTPYSGSPADTLVPSAPYVNLRVPGVATFVGAVTLSGSLLGGAAVDIGSVTTAQQFRYGYFSGGLVIGDAGATTIPAGAAGQLRIYRSAITTTGTDWERLSMEWAGVIAYIQTHQGGLGAARALHVRTVGAGNVVLGTDATVRWTVAHTTGHLTATGDLNIETTGIVTGATFKSGATQVVGAQQAAIADATDAASVILRCNDMIAAARAHGLIAT